VKKYLTSVVREGNPNPVERDFRRESKREIWKRGVKRRGWGNEGSPSLVNGRKISE